jgi:hypothetical protein
MTSLKSAAGALRGLNIGYIWMFTNCLTSAAYVCVQVVSNLTHLLTGYIGSFYAQENKVDWLL